MKRIYILLGLFVVVMAAWPFRGVIQDRFAEDVYEQQEGYKTVDDRLRQYGDRVRGRLKPFFAKVGIEYKSFNRWRKEFREFYLAVEDAEMECKLRNIGFIQDAAEEDWRAAMSWLERRYPEEYGGNKHELTHKFTAGAENTRLLLELLLKGTDEVRTKPKKRPQKVSR